MIYIVWRERNELGIPIIDEQHRGIVSTINSLHYFIQGGHGLEVLKPTLAILEQYTDIHFRTEEALLVQVGYPELDAHKALHATLMRETIRMSREALLQHEPEIALRFLKEWWLGHIGEEDRKYAPCVKKKLGLGE